MTTISDGTTTITPILISGYESSRTSRNVVHPILGTNVPAVSLRAAGLRTGTLTALVANRAAAVALETVLAKALLLTYTDPDTTLSMTFVLDGEARVKLDPDTLTLWTVVWDYSEVT